MEHNMYHLSMKEIELQDDLQSNWWVLMVGRVIDCTGCSRSKIGYLRVQKPDPGESNSD